MKIGIIGLGFVGTAIKNAYDFPVLVSDPAKNLFTPYAKLCKCDAVFICVPSPSKPDGSCNTSILENVLNLLGASKGVLISKVTAPPEVYSKLQKKHPNLVHVPEFLVAANANEDYLNETFSLVGGHEPYRQLAIDAIRLGQKKLKNVDLCSIEEASLVKYTINSFLALKVSYMNQLYEYAQAQGINYNRVRELFDRDSRIGSSHTIDRKSTRLNSSHANISY